MTAVDTVELRFPAAQTLGEPDLAFDPHDTTHRHPHPLHGLLTFGPYSGDLLKSYQSAIRIAVVAPPGEYDKVAVLMRELGEAHQPRERKDYLTGFPGFAQVFGLPLVKARAEANIELPAELDDIIAQRPDPHLALAGALGDALATLTRVRDTFDVIVVYLPNRWRQAFKGRSDEDFDLHDYFKAIASARSLPTQIVRQDHALDYFCRCSVAWRLSIALYVKAGGVPWKLADAEPDTAYIGLSYALRNDTSGMPRYVTCASQVFDADGGGLEFVAYEAQGATLDLDNPFLSRDHMRAVMARSARLYQDRHAGRLPRRLVVHKTTPFKDDEIDGCFDAWNAVGEIELVQVQSSVAWRGVRLLAPKSQRERSRPDGYPVHRGTMVHLSGTEVLLWVQGNAPAAVRGRNFYKEGRAIPRPLLLTRHAGHGSADVFCREVLALAKMNWNNDSLYDFLPTTLRYARTLAQTIKRMPEIDPRPYPFRLFM